jgi:hypothetical protein
MVKAADRVDDVTESPKLHNRPPECTRPRPGCEPDQSGGSMMSKCLVTFAAVAFGFFATALTGMADSGAPPNAVPTIAAFTKDMTRLEGALTLFRRENDGALFFKIPESGTVDLLYQASLASGFGQRLVTNDGTQTGTSLDRGYLGPSRLVTFRPIGGKVLLIERNTNYFTPTAEFGSEHDTGYSFPDSVVASFEIKAREGDSLVLDATGFFKRDDIGVSGALRASKQGSFVLDEQRSAVNSFSATSSELGLDVEAILTFTTTDGKPENDLLTDVAANRNAVLVREHHSFFKLDDLGSSRYQARPFDLSAGYFDNTFYDPFQPLSEAVRRSYIVRHSLTRKDPAALVGDPEKPIVFYIDPSVPTELRQVVVDGVLWWAPAFEKAGFHNALQVRDLPNGLNPLSVGLNVIIWIPRTTRGWSYGSDVVDPRTGQILKAIVRLDGMRLRADRLLFDALTAPYGDQPDLDKRDAALNQRLKLLVAHEVGHAFGLRHQYIGSAQGNSSVMDYPFPNITVDSEGKPHLLDVFPTSVGPWDTFMIRYGYQSFPPGKEAIEVQKLTKEVEGQGYYWMTDEDAGDADPFVQKWDFGGDPIAQLNAVLSIRKAALLRFSTAVIPRDEPLAGLREALVPIYLLHQYAVRSVAAMLGGFTYQYSMRDGVLPKPIVPKRQRQALRALLLTLDPNTLNLGRDIARLMAPHPPTYPASRESFQGSTGAIFDTSSPIENASRITLQEILKPSRTARLTQSSSWDNSAPGLREVLNAIVDYTWKEPKQDGDLGITQRTIAVAVVQSLLLTSSGSGSAPAVRGTCWLVLDELEKWMKANPPDVAWQDAYAFVSHSLKEDPSKFSSSQTPIPLLDPM